MSKTKPAAAQSSADPTAATEPTSAGKAVGYSRLDATPPAISCADTAMGGYQDVSGREERVRTLAYRLWEEAGRPDGRETEFWTEADRRTRKD